VAEIMNVATSYRREIQRTKEVITSDVQQNRFSAKSKNGAFEILAMKVKAVPPL
jgi:hypothetical protein